MRAHAWIRGRAGESDAAGPSLPPALPGREAPPALPVPGEAPALHMSPRCAPGPSAWRCPRGTCPAPCAAGGSAQVGEESREMWRRGEIWGQEKAEGGERRREARIPGNHAEVAAAARPVFGAATLGRCHTAAVRTSSASHSLRRAARCSASALRAAAAAASSCFAAASLSRCPSACCSCRGERREGSTQRAARSHAAQRPSSDTATALIKRQAPPAASA